MDDKKNLPEWAKVAIELYKTGSGTEHANLVRKLKGMILEATQDELEAGFKTLTTEEMDNAASYMHDVSTCTEDNENWMPIWEYFNTLGYGGVSWRVQTGGKWTRYDLGREPKSNHEPK